MSSHQDEVHAKHELIPWSLFIIVWLCLLVFTGLTVAVAGLNLQALSVPVALAIAATKALLVLMFFMHIKYEDRVFLMFLGIAFVTISVILLLTFADVIFRF